MAKISIIALFELRSTLRRRTYQIMTIAFPILGIMAVLVIRLIVTLAEDEAPPLRGYVDEWGGLPATAPRETFLVAYLSEENARTALLGGQIVAYYVVPPDYVETGTLREYTTKASGVFDGSAAPPALRLLLVEALIAGEVAPDIAARVQSPVLVDTVRLTGEGKLAPPERDPFSRFLIPYVFSLLLMMAIFFPSGFLVQSVTEEKQSRTIEVLLSSVAPPVLMAGKVLGLGAAGLVQVSIWLASAWGLAVFAGSFLPLPSSLTIEPVMLGLGALFFMLGYLFYGTILAGIGALATSPQEGGQISGLAAMFSVIPLFFITPIIDDPYGTIARILTFFPPTTPVTVMLRLSSATLPWLDIIGSALLLALSSLGAVFLSARFFRAFLLLYGRRPGFREIWRTLWTA